MPSMLVPPAFVYFSGLPVSILQILQSHGMILHGFFEMLLPARGSLIIFLKIAFFCHNQALVFPPKILRPTCHVCIFNMNLFIVSVNPCRM